MPKYQVDSHHPQSEQDRTQVWDAEDEDQATRLAQDGGWIVDKIEDISDEKPTEQPDGFTPAQEGHGVIEKPTAKKAPAKAAAKK